jgi:arylsulfatase A-like enzyme
MGRSAAACVARRRRVAAVWGAAAILLAMPISSCREAPEPSERIVLITLDTLRYDRLSGTDRWPADMPETRRFAEDALAFRRHYSATSATQPTHATLLTALHPWQHGVPRNGTVLAAGVQTIVERMREAGFRSAAVVASFPLHRRFGFDQGFDLYADEFTEVQHGEWLGAQVPGGRFFSRADEVTSKALEMLDSVGGSKQFFWFHYFDPHSPYGDSTGRTLAELPEIDHYLRSGGRDVGPLLARARQGYSEDVRFLDGSLQKLLRRLLEDSDRIETHIIVVADHGESFGEGGAFGHNKRTTMEQIHVPLLIHSPRVTPGVSDLATGSIDIAATLLALAGIPQEEVQGGRNLLAGDLEQGFIFGMGRNSERPFQELRTDGSIEVIDGTEFFAVEGDRLFTGDGRRVSAGDGSAVDGKTAEKLERTFERFEGTLRGGSIDELDDPETREALEALGYVD